MPELGSFRIRTRFSSYVSYGPPSQLFTSQPLASPFPISCNKLCTQLPRSPSSEPFSFNPLWIYFRLSSPLLIYSSSSYPWSAVAKLQLRQTRRHQHDPPPLIFHTHYTPPSAPRSFLKKVAKGLRTYRNLTFPPLNPPARPTALTFPPPLVFSLTRRETIHLLLMNTPPRRVRRPSPPFSSPKSTRPVNFLSLTSRASVFCPLSTRTLGLQSLSPSASGSTTGAYSSNCTHPFWLFPFFRA